MAKKKKQHVFTFRTDTDHPRLAYFRNLRRWLARESGRHVSYQETFEHILDIMRESSNLNPGDDE